MIARSSLFELLDTLDEGLLKGYLTREEYAHREQQIQLTIRTVSALRSYLQSTPTPKRRTRTG